MDIAKVVSVRLAPVVHLLLHYEHFYHPPVFQILQKMKSCTISRHAQGLLTAFFAVLILSLDTLLTRKLGNVPNFVVIFYKNFLFAMPMMLYLLVTSGVQGTIDKFRHIGPYGWFAGLVWGTSNLLITYGFQIIEVATVLVIVAANPMFAAIFSYLILKEPVPWYTMLAGLVCFGAIVVIFYSELTSSNSPNVGGLLAALGSAITMGLYFVLLRFIDARSERYDTREAVMNMVASWPNRSSSFLLDHLEHWIRCLAM